MPSPSAQPFPRFASLPGTPGSVPSDPSWFARFFLTPFRDVDDRAARLMAAARAEREVRQAAMSAADAPAG
jgi:hypothetical protein